MSRHGRGDAAPARPSRPSREGRLDYPPKVVETLTQGAQKVTGFHGGRMVNVTGADSGAVLPISGTQYIGAESGAGWRAAAVKVGHARTPGGLVVSGTQVRSQTRVTGDEAGDSARITGDADQQLADDLGRHQPDCGLGLTQFRRQANPHGRALFAGAASGVQAQPGSRERDRSAAFEATENGMAITGSVLGRSTRVTGDEDGACRQVTGDQYLTPARRQAECGGVGGGTGPAERFPAGRRDPASGAKVAMSRTWGGQPVSGCDLEHNPRVTGDEPGTCSLLTGTPYQGANSARDACVASFEDTAGAQLARHPAYAPVTGDVPLNSAGVSGTARGVDREITGTPYYRGTPVAEESSIGDVGAIDQSFSVRSPMRGAQLHAKAQDAALARSRITGAFAVGDGKVTGNLEFLFRSRAAGSAESPPAHTKLTGEGSSTGRVVTGAAWAPHERVTGTEGRWVTERSASQRAGKPHEFAGVSRFEKLEKHDEPRRKVTGMVGWSSKSAAKVTLSGGAHG